MDFTQIDNQLKKEFSGLEYLIDINIKHDIEAAKHKIEKLCRRAHMDLRTFTHLEKHVPYGRIDIDEMRCYTNIDLEKIIGRVPNTHLVEVSALHNKSGYFSKIKIEVYSTFEERFKTNAQLEAEYEYDVMYLINYVKPIGLYADVKFFHYYL